MAKEEKGKMERFTEFINTIRGRKDAKSRVDVMANPENLATMSILTQGQVEFCAVAGWASDHNRGWGDMWRGLNDYAEALKAHSISKGGRGREQAIQFVASLSESKILGKLGLTVSGEDKKK